MIDEATLDIPVLYVLMRTDLPDPAAGKTLAQCNHAGTKFMDSAWRDTTLDEITEEWTNAGGGFGTCVVLGATYRELRRSLQAAANFDFPTGLVHDPEYPIRDGDTMKHLAIDTCGYIFGRKSQLSGLLGGYSLYN